MITEVIIEIPANSNYKYEIDKHTGELVLDRVLKLQVPFNYGYVPNTLSEDGDPLDIFVISRGQIFPKTRVQVEIVGVYRCVDNGQEDDKLVGILVGEEDVKSEMAVVDNLLKYYLSNYKPGFHVLGYEGALPAELALSDSTLRNFEQYE